MAPSSSWAKPLGKCNTLHSLAVPGKQRRIVRTYGQKRAASDTVGVDESTLSTSKRRQRNEPEGDSDSVEDEERKADKGEDYKATPREENPTTVATETAVNGGSDAKKAVGIMRYFQAAAAVAIPLHSETQASASSQDSPEEGTPLSSSPLPSLPLPSLPLPSLPLPSPSSPASGSTAARPRSKRRLTIRPDQLAQATKDKEKAAAGKTESLSISAGNTSKTGSMAASSMRMRKRLRMSGPSRHNQQTAPSIQTTLSLGGGDAFRECKECNVLYNPLHEKDVKFHARYHASLCQKQGSESGE